MPWERASHLERAGREAQDHPDVVIETMKLKNGDVVAEIGAGTGYYTRRVARAIAPEGTVWANDIQPEMLEIMAEYLERDGIKNVRQVLGDEDDPKLPAGTFDWILLVDVYHEIQQPEPMLAKIRDALKPDGRVALVEYRAEGTSAASVSRSHRMSKEEIRAEWEPAGFEVVDVVDELPRQHMFVFKRR